MMTYWIGGLMAVLFMGAASYAAEIPAEEDVTVHMLRQTRIERAKEEEIRALQMEVEHARLELEKKKILSEMNTAGGSSSLANTPSAENDSVQVRYVFSSAAHKEAALEINGVPMQGREGEQVRQYIIKHIGSTEVLLISPDGKELKVPVKS